jgi:hypothetical protein
LCKNGFGSSQKNGQKADDKNKLSLVFHVVLFITVTNF